MASLSRTCSNMTMNTCLIFPPKTAWDPRQRDMVANFWTAPTAWFQDGTRPNSRLTCPSVTSYCCSAEGLPDHFRAPDTWWKTTVKALSIKLQFSQQFFVGCSTELMTPKLWYKFGNFLLYGFWEKWFRSLELSPSLATSALIMEPNTCGLHDLECLTTFQQNFSAVATSNAQLHRWTV